MKKQLDFYHSQIELHSAKISVLNKKLLISSVLRSVLFLVLCFGIYFFWGERRILFSIIIAGIILFIYLVSRHSDIKDNKNKEEELVKLNNLEIKILTTRDFHDLPSGTEFDSGQHAYAQDIDLFGKGSFFQYINRTALLEGKQRLAFWLQENETSQIEEKQEAIKELAEKAIWRQEFTANARLMENKTTAAYVTDWFKNYKRFVPAYIKWLPWLISILSVILIIAYGMSYITGMQLVLYYMLNLLFTGYFLKKVTFISQHTDKIQDLFHQYHQLISLLESENFDSEILRKNKDLVILKDKKASEVIKKFSRAIDSFNQRNNVVFGIVANGFLMWDLRYSLQMENWIAEYGDKVGSWFEVLEKTDAYISLGNFAFNHPHYTFPEIVNNEAENLIVAKQLSHPLLNPEKAVKNDFSIAEEQFFIITGANMAGKSTFLRTVSLQIVMSNLGLPVCADSCQYRPIKLITSMRTTDSLTEDESYFFSELKRLQYIVNQIKTDRYFIILDEILKGTNSTDKAIGSRKFIQKLVGSNSTGIIATHDLSLCEVANELPQVKNHYFDAEIIDDELHFDYKFKDGICQNMNASFLLKKMHIVD